MYNLGLIGKNLQNSFSKKFFQKKFKKENLTNFSYKLYDLDNIKDFNLLLINKNITGLNVTSPYKESVIKYINHLDEISNKTKSVNTIFINNKTNKTKGYNTDVYGFKKSLELFTPKSNLKAIVLGNGGVSKSICFVLKEKKIDYIIVSRNNNKKDIISYKESEKYLKTHKLIINTTILGSNNLINFFPNINYNLISNKHYMYDLIYNPKETFFLKKGKEKGAKIMNGKKMLELQAEFSFRIWIKEIQSKKNV